MRHFHEACPFMAGRECLLEGCMAWREENCSLILRVGASPSPFEQKLRNAAPLMYRSLLDLVKIMEGDLQRLREVRARAVGLCPGSQSKPAGRADQGRAGQGWNKRRINTEEMH